MYDQRGAGELLRGQVVVGESAAPRYRLGGDAQLLKRHPDSTGGATAAEDQGGGGQGTGTDPLAEGGGKALHVGIVPGEKPLPAGDTIDRAYCRCERIEPVEIGDDGGLVGCGDVESVPVVGSADFGDKGLHLGTIDEPVSGAEEALAAEDFFEELRRPTVADVASE